MLYVRQGRLLSKTTHFSHSQWFLYLTAKTLFLFSVYPFYSRMNEQICWTFTKKIRIKKIINKRLFCSLILVMQKLACSIYCQGNYKCKQGQNLIFESNFFLYLILVRVSMGKGQIWFWVIIVKKMLSVRRSCQVEPCMKF